MAQRYGIMDDFKFLHQFAGGFPGITGTKRHHAGVIIHLACRKFVLGMGCRAGVAHQFDLGVVLKKAG